MRPIRAVLGILIFFAVLFVPAGRLDWAEGWAFFIAFLTGVLLISVWGLLRAPELMEERRRIARELHDGVAQSLGYINLKTKLVNDSVASQNTVQALTELNEVRKVVQDTYEDIRESIDQLSTEIRNLSIIPALSTYTKEFDNNTGIKVQFNVPKAFPRLSPVAELQLLRITQEALTNVRRHAMATEVGVKLKRSSDTIEMIIKDNGQGFNPSDLEKALPGYHGLNIIKERAEGLGGSVDISTAPGEGTEIRVSLPIEKVRF